MVAMLQEAQGKTADAEAGYKRVLAIDPLAAIAANNLAWLYVASERNLDEAMQYAQTAQQRLLPGATQQIAPSFFRQKSMLFRQW